MQVLLTAAKTQKKRISVYVSESRPSGQGLRTYNRLMAEGIPCTVVLDSAVAYIVHKADMCLIGAEGVVESGGLFNAVGSYQMGIVAKAAHKPVFAVAERYVDRLTQLQVPPHVSPLPVRPAERVESAAVPQRRRGGERRRGDAHDAGDGGTEPLGTSTRSPRSTIPSPSSSHSS